MRRHISQGGMTKMITTSEVLDHHLKSFAEYDVDGAVADYSSDAVLFVPSGPLSTFMTRGTGLPHPARALRRNRLAAAASRLAVSRKSIVCPMESTARYRYLS